MLTNSIEESIFTLKKKDIPQCAPCINQIKDLARPTFESEINRLTGVVS